MIKCDNNSIKSFMADCYNSFGDIIDITNKKTNELEYIKIYKLL